MLNELELRWNIANGETSTVELKKAVPRPTELAERLCGMANAQGGIIIIGVEDTSLKIIGVPDTRMALTKDMILRAARQIEPPLVLDPAEPEVYLIDGKQLVIANVPPNRGPIYQASGVCWIRRGTYTIPLRVSEMLELSNDRGLQDWELQPARNATIADISIEHVNAHLSERLGAKQNQSRFTNIKQILVGMECARITKNGETVPTNAGILFFGHNPQQHIMQSEIVCMRYRDVLGIREYIDYKIVTGTIKELIDGTEAFMLQHLRSGARIEMPEFPLRALREAIVNAVIHRDYSKRGESIRVFYYADRIEIHSPGSLLPGMSIEKMQRGEETSKLRNPILANLLRDTPGYMERIGSGIRLMLDETKQMGLPAPQLREQNKVIVTFPSVLLLESL